MPKTVPGKMQAGADRENFSVQFKLDESVTPASRQADRNLHVPQTGVTLRGRARRLRSNRLSPFRPLRAGSLTRNGATPPLRVKRGTGVVRRGHGREPIETGLRSRPPEAFGELKEGCRYTRRCTCPGLRAAPS